MLKKILLGIGGGLFLALGFIGLVVPIMPGIPFIILGLIMLGKYEHVVGKIKAWLAKRKERKTK